MPSSTSSSSERQPLGLRLNASHRPGVAQPVPERDIPDRPWGGISVAALVVALALVGAWEWHWRAYGVEPSPANSEDAWATQRRRIDQGDGARTVITGASRMLFDVDLDTWERVSGARPIQLALEGTSPLPVLENLADDPALTGHVLVGVAPDVFFSGYVYRGTAVRHFQKQSPAERVGQWLSVHFVEPYLAFDDPDFSLSSVVLREGWPLRTGMKPNIRVRKLSVSDPDRNTRMWSKVENDPEYRALARSIWAQDFEPLDAAGQAELDEKLAAQIDRAVKVVAKLRARGVDVTFVRAPSGADYLAYENRDYPRAKTWDVLLAKTGARGIHFEDYPELQGYDLPEWSHMAAHERPRFTEALYRIVAHTR